MPRRTVSAADLPGSAWAWGVPCISGHGAPHNFPLPIPAGEESGSIVSAIPTEYPVTMTDGVNDYIVSNATEYVNAVYKLGHSPKTDESAQRRRAAKSK